jgi:hypothetical protein
MLGTTVEELGGLRAVEDEQTRREQIMQQRALKPQVKVRSSFICLLCLGARYLTTVNVQLRSTGPSPLAPSSKYCFHRIAPLPHLPNPSSAQTVLDKLANDPAILHVMSTHQFSVGLLTELAPHEHSGLLGLNVNAGQEIKLRIRTNEYDGFRLYSEIRRVLCHELAHNVWGDHDENVRQYSPPPFA